MREREFVHVVMDDADMKCAFRVSMLFILESVEVNPELRAARNVLAGTVVRASGTSTLLPLPIDHLCRMMTLRNVFGFITRTPFTRTRRHVLNVMKYARERDVKLKVDPNLRKLCIAALFQLGYPTARIFRCEERHVIAAEKYALRRALDVDVVYSLFVYSSVHHSKPVRLFPNYQ